MQVRSCRVTPTLLRHPTFLKALNLLTPVLVTYISHLFILRIQYGKSLPRTLAYENVGISCRFRYMMMAVEQRRENDQRTMGLMFHFFCDEQKGKVFSEALSLLLSLLVDKMTEFLFLSKQQINVFMDKFIDSLPAHFNALKLYRVCET